MLLFFLFRLLSTPHPRPIRHMANLRTLWPIRTDFDLGYNHQQNNRSARGWSPRGCRNRLDNAPINAHREVEHEEGGQARSQNQVRYVATAMARITLKPTNPTVSIGLAVTGGASTVERATLIRERLCIHILSRRGVPPTLTFHRMEVFNFRTGRKPIQSLRTAPSSSPIPGP